MRIVCLLNFLDTAETSDYGGRHGGDFDTAGGGLF